ncbi:hypothetical protein [Flavimaricola marinus]|uniref:Uncharacterized protein n=1 Tax=Flavimaricola marinus TaxID=1819565 RepID=A0A238LHN7_9RHOB|nr:hypothetical protein [Flavimaricola marinus]SMY09257.1 hypothetical protein LOM8899_03422 [Flavimaricola marinus]
MNTDDFPPPVIILAAPGLPSQTLAAALGQGPAAYDLPELNLEQMVTIDVFQREMIGIRSTQVHGLLRAIAQLYAGEQTQLSVEMAGRWMTRRAYLSTGAVAQELAAKIAPRRMVIPVTATVFDKASLRRLRANFPDATYLHLHLHPHQYGRLLWSTTNGQVAIQLSGSFDESTDPPTPDPQELWLMAETAITEFLADLDEDQQVIDVKAAELASDPRPLLARLARALGLPATGVAQKAMMSPERSPFAGPGPMGAHVAGTIQSFADLAAAMPDPETAQLDGPLPWRTDGVGFREPVRAHAEKLGYAPPKPEPKPDDPQPQADDGPDAAAPPA